MDLDRLADEAKKLIEKRGGMDSVKEDAMELRDVATSDGSLMDKAKAAAEALRDPGAPGEAATPPTDPADRAGG